MMIKEKNSPDNVEIHIYFYIGQYIINIRNILFE